MWTHAICLMSLTCLALSGCSEPQDGGSSTDPARGVRAIHEAAAADNDRAAQQVAKAVQDNDTATAREAVAALGRMSTPAAVEALGRIATSEPRAEMRQLGVAALAGRGEPRAAEVLRQVLRSDSSPEVRGEAAAGLARVGSLDDVDPLVSAATTETDPLAIRREIAAIERFVGVKFRYDPAAPPEEQQRVLEAVRTFASRLAHDIKTGQPRGPSCADTRSQPSSSPPPGQKGGK